MGVIVFVCGTGDYDMSNGFSVKTVDDAIAATYMILEAVSLRLWTCWLSRYDSNMVKRRLGIPEDMVVSSVLAIGYAEVGWSKPVRPVSEAITFNEWDA